MPVALHKAVMSCCQITWSPSHTFACFFPIATQVHRHSPFCLSATRSSKMWIPSLKVFLCITWWKQPPSHLVISLTVFRHLYFFLASQAYCILPSHPLTTAEVVQPPGPSPCKALGSQPCERSFLPRAPSRLWLTSSCPFQPHARYLLKLNHFNRKTKQINNSKRNMGG